MASRLENIEKQAAFMQGQIVNLLRMNEKLGLPSDNPELVGAIATWQKRLHTLYTEEMPLAKMKDNSDLLIRAIGVNADHDEPMLKTVVSLADRMRENLNKLTRSISPMMKSISHNKIAETPWVFNGYAPGSIIMGFSLQQPSPESLTIDSDKILYDSLSITAQNIAVIPSFLGEERLNDAVAEVITDPAIRDTVLIATHNISPSSRSGLHTIEVGAKTGEYGDLTNKSRMILAQEIKKPHLIKKVKGSFTGVLESADIGKERAILRSVIEKDIEAIRCFVPTELSHQVKAGFAEFVKITGEYETDKDGKPRLFNVHSIQKVESGQVAIDIT